MRNAASVCESRRDVRRRERQTVILDIAEHLFYTDGYSGTTMSAIAAALGGSKGTLWSYFASKELLFSAVLDRATETFRRETAAIFLHDDSLKNVLITFCTRFLVKATQTEAINLYRLVVGEAARFPEMGRIFFDRVMRGTREQLAAYLEGSAGKQLRPNTDVTYAARYLLGMCLSGCHMQLLLGLIQNVSRRQIEEEVDIAVESFLNSFIV